MTSQTNSSKVTITTVGVLLSVKDEVVIRHISMTSKEGVSDTAAANITSSRIW